MSGAQSSGAERHIGRPFPKGLSGNPGGRPRGVRELRAKLIPHGDEMINALLETIRSGSGAVRLEAIKVGLSYLFGKPDAFDPMALTDEELLAIVQARQAEEAESGAIEKARDEAAIKALG